MNTPTAPIAPTPTLPRRDFLKTSATLAAGAALTPRFLTAA